MENLKRMCVGQYIFRKATVEDMTHIAALSIRNELGNAEFDDEEYIFLMKILPNELSDLCADLVILTGRRMTNLVSNFECLF